MVDFERMVAIIEKFEDKIEANNEKVEVLRGTLISRISRERMEALIDVSLDMTEACLEKIEVNQGKVEIKMDRGRRDKSGDYQGTGGPIWGLASGCKVLWTANCPGRSWPLPEDG
jgi:hypothetical protein